MGWLANILFLVCLAYFAFTCREFYGVFYPTKCVYESENSPGECLLPAVNPESSIDIKIVAVDAANGKKRTQILLTKLKHPMIESFQEVVEVNVSAEMRNNGTLSAFLEVVPSNMKRTAYATSMSAPLTHLSQELSFMNLMKSPDGNEDKGDLRNNVTGSVITHLRNELSLSIMTDNFPFTRTLPNGIHRQIKFTQSGRYLPIWTADSLSLRVKDLRPLNKDTADVLNMTISYKSMSIGKYNMILTIEDSVRGMKDMGFSDKDLDDIKGIFLDTNFFLLILTVFVSVFHILFDFLAFKNDISFWRNKKDMVGLSMTGVVWRFVSHFIVSLYLLDQDTSKLVLIPMLCGTVIELWKVTKALKVRVIMPKDNGKFYPTVAFGDEEQNEKSTNEFDNTALYYLSFLLAPLLVGGAVYSLFYVPHKSVYSWVMQSLVNGVYAFGFLFMMPQLFVNYKLKSVAHLPWRAFMYKAFNTFIDDIFAFIITMPTAHRLACFRDDFVFVIYLYQRYLYPVDKTRVNEYGQAFDENAEDTTVESKKTK